MRLEPEQNDSAPDERGAATAVSAARQSRGGSAYQHRLSARGIKSSGAARSASDEDLLASMERLERAARMSSFEDEGLQKRPYGRRERGAGTGTPGVTGKRIEERVRGPRVSW